MSSQQARKRVVSREEFDRIVAAKAKASQTEKERKLEEDLAYATNNLRELTGDLKLNEEILKGARDDMAGYKNYPPYHWKSVVDFFHDLTWSLGGIDHAGKYIDTGNRSILSRIPWVRLGMIAAAALFAIAVITDVPLQRGVGGYVNSLAGEIEIGLGATVIVVVAVALRNRSPKA